MKRFKLTQTRPPGVARAEHAACAFLGSFKFHLLVKCPSERHAAAGWRRWPRSRAVRADHGRAAPPEPSSGLDPHPPAPGCPLQPMLNAGRTGGYGNTDRLHVGSVGVSRGVFYRKRRGFFITSCKVHVSTKKANRKRSWIFSRNNVFLSLNFFQNCLLNFDCG